MNTDINDDFNNAIELADFMYTTYCKAVGGVAFDGKPLPDWNTFVLDPSKLKQSNAWIYTASETIKKFKS